MSSALPRQADQSRHRTRAPRLRGDRTSGWWLAAEGLVATVTALLMTWLARFVQIDPVSRIGQVSGLAALQLRLLLLLAVILLIAIPAMRRWTAVPLQLASAAVAGLCTGVTAAGVALALHGTSWPLYAQGATRERCRAGPPRSWPASRWTPRTPAVPAPDRLGRADVHRR